MNNEINMKHNNDFIAKQEEILNLGYNGKSKEFPYDDKYVYNGIETIYYLIGHNMCIDIRTGNLIKKDATDFKDISNTIQTMINYQIDYKL